MYPLCPSFFCSEDYRHFMAAGHGSVGASFVQKQFSHGGSQRAMRVLCNSLCEPLNNLRTAGVCVCFCVSLFISIAVRG